MPARSINRWEAISASFGVSRRLGRKNRERRMESRKSGRGSETGTAPETQGQEFGQVFGGGIWGGIFLPFAVGSLVTKAHGSITSVFAQSRNRHLGNEISGKRSKSWEDNTRTRKAASLPRCGRVKSNKYAELKGSDEDSRAGLLPCFFFWRSAHGPASERLKTAPGMLK